MPEYLAPGVYVEETSFRSKSIEGVSTTTTGFIGPTRYGPIDLEPDIITSLGEFERIYGDRQKLNFSDTGPIDNFMWHAVRAFFEEGGKRLYISRVFTPADGIGNIASGSPPAPAGVAALEIKARFPGAAGNVRVRFDLVVGQNILSEENGNPRARGVLDNDVVWIGDVTSPISSPPGTGQLYIARRDQATQQWLFESTGSPPNQLKLDDLDADRGDQLRLLTVNVTVFPSDPEGFTSVWPGLAPDPSHQRAGAPDSLFAKFGENPGKPGLPPNTPVVSLGQARTLPIVISRGTFKTGLDVLQALFQIDPLDLPNPDSVESAEASLKDGKDGQRPDADSFIGDDVRKTGLVAFEDIEDISIVAAPGSTFGYENGYRQDANTIINSLIGHAQKMKYRIAVLDSGDKQAISQVRAMRGRFDSTYGALYYPWIRILDPLTRQEINVPPSGAVAGIYARNDINRAVYKAPANEVVNTAIGFEQLLNKSQQDVLNPEGINCFRFFEGRGFRLWGARTISSDPEWKYVNLRRYFAYLERSIDKGTQWAVFEPNGEALWANVRRTIEDFLLNEWQSGALLGDKPDKAYFVKCDRSTMTQNDLDNGRLICLIGVAPLRPAEFVIFRIGQWTADRKA